VDHSEDRVIDWKTVAPRWVLISSLVVSFGVNGLLGSMLVSWAGQWKDKVEQDRRDPQWEVLSDHSQRLGVLESKNRQQEALLRDLDVRSQLLELKGDLREMRAEFRLANARLTREIKEN
jgi:hypothetical protein